MVRALLLVIELAILILIAYNLAVALAGWRNPLSPLSPIGRWGSSPSATRGEGANVASISTRTPFVVVIPAFNEERVIRRSLADLTPQLAKADELWVLADRCTDATAAVARSAGAAVAERTEGPDGKGPVLSWFIAKRPIVAGEALVVIDADNRVPPNLLDRFAAELEGGHHVLQGYLDVSNPDASALAAASALSYWASNRMVQLARTNLGWTADLGGTGMCLTAEALTAAGGFGSSLVEDQELGVRSFLAGYPVRWLHDVKVADEKPATAGVAIRQRSRWTTGRRQVARRWFAKVASSRQPGSIDLALRLVQPSRMGIALLSALLAVASGLGAPLLPWQLWAAVALVQLLAPLPFLIRDRVPSRYLRSYPLLALLPLLKISGRLRRNREWYHTPHGLSDVLADGSGRAE